jgi:hypothetical protein
MQTTYEMDFFKALTPVITKSNCKHCHGTGISGYVKGSGALICMCVKKTIAAKKAARKRVA